MLAEPPVVISSQLDAPQSKMGLCPNETIVSRALTEIAQRIGHHPAH